MLLFLVLLLELPDSSGIFIFILNIISDIRSLESNYYYYEMSAYHATLIYFYLCASALPGTIVMTKISVYP